ncbi:porin family protein [Marinobacter shengliensis]|uniref:porin family protein n=1 Tax=Marinobacter shengliensis TaxID=1389223 RepID=UPI000D0FB779|nr:porin family protein [Marinobacter shengliensis]PSF11417.1 porin family protein [Marinobacter shengliensis]
MNVKKNLLLASVASAGIAVAGTASAQDMYKSGVGSLYAGLNYTFMDVDFDGFASADVGTLSGKVGVMANEFLGIEARAGFGVDDDRVFGQKAKLDNFFGGYATINMANQSPVTPYAVVGFTRIEAEIGPQSDDDSDFSYGAGVNFKFAQNLSGNLEYMRYYDDSNVTVDGIGLGIQMNF